MNTQTHIHKRTSLRSRSSLATSITSVAMALTVDFNVFTAFHILTPKLQFPSVDILHLNVQTKSVVTHLYQHPPAMEVLANSTRVRCPLRCKIPETQRYY
eukprot:4639088-Pyramimonas_sp.AAC.2